MFSQCPACTLSFGTPPSDTMPMLLSCAHTICSSCADACAIVPPFLCPVCTSETTWVVVNHVLAQAVQDMQTDAKSPLSDMLEEPEHDCGNELSALSDMTVFPELENLKKTFHEIQLAGQRLLCSKDTLAAHVDSAIELYQDGMRALMANMQQHMFTTVALAKAICADRVKMLEAQADEWIVSSGQLSACILASEKAVASGNCERIRHAIAYTKIMQTRCETSLEPCVPLALDVVIDANAVLEQLDATTRLRLFEIDESKSSAGGSGVRFCFVKDIGLNEVKVTCMEGSGNPADWVTADDVCLHVTNGSGDIVGRMVSVNHIHKGNVWIQYEVDDSTTDEEVLVDIRIKDKIVHGSPWQVMKTTTNISANAQLVTTLPFSGDDYYSVAVTPDGQYVIGANDCISVYRVDTGECMSTFGRERGLAAGAFNFPFCISATSRSSILVADYLNARIQEVSLVGEHLRFLGGDFLGTDRIRGMCMHGDTVAVGKSSGNTNGRVVLFSYSTNSSLRTFGCYGILEKQIGNVTDLCFSSDGKQILVAEKMSRLSLFTVEGVFIKTFGAGVISGRFYTNIFFSGTSIFVADDGNNRLCVFSTETDAFQTLEVRNPRALAGYKNKLFVLSRHDGVHIFE